MKKPRIGRGTVALLCVAGIFIAAVGIFLAANRLPVAANGPEQSVHTKLPSAVSSVGISASPSAAIQTAVASSAPAPTATPYVNKALTDAIAANKDVVGLITIPGTDISYPVLQTKNNTYYLTHNAKGDYAKAGAIFMDYRCDSQLLRHNIILYGHHMKDDSMFATLVNYKSKNFFEQHKVIQYATPSGLTQWEVFSAYVTSTSFYYIQTDFTSNGMYLDFINKIQKKSLYKTDTVLTNEDDVLTLSTCTYEFDNARFVVHARRIK